MGTPVSCMMLSGVRLMGSNMLKYTRDSDTSLWSTQGTRTLPCKKHCTMSPWRLWDTTGRHSWGRVEDAHTTPGSAPASQNWSWHWMSLPGSCCWGSSPVPPHSPAYYKISYIISYLISYYMKHQYLTVLSPKAVACQVEWIASCLWPSAASVELTL
jgi:hypothetical protein